MSSIRCHTVPTFYLEYFLPKDSSVFWVYDKENFESRQQSPDTTTVIGDYYLSHPDPKTGKKDKRIEQPLFSSIEGAAKPILDEIIKKPTLLKREEKEVLAIFLSFLFCRVTRAVETVKEGGDVALEHIKEIAQEEAKDEKKVEEVYKIAMQEIQEKSITLEEFKNLMRNPSSYEVFSFDEKYAIGQSLEITLPILSCLMKMNWSICIAKDRFFFITSDAPVNVFTPVGNGEVIFGSGFGKPNVQIVFPVNPKICFSLTYSLKEEVKRVGFEFVKEMNRRAIVMAQQYIISTYKSNNIKKWMLEFPNFGKPKLDKDYLRNRFKQEISSEEEEREV